MTRIESIIALYKASNGVDTVAPATVATYANLADTVTLETISSTIMANSILKAGFEIAPVADVVEQFFISLFGYTQAEVDALRATEEGAAGFQYWEDELANNADIINVNTLAIALLNGAGEADAASAAALVADEVAAYELFTGEDTTDVVETAGETVYLTAGQDILTGTDGNDTFIARGNSSLDNADIIDGGAGTDTLKVMLDNEETAERPMLTNIEILEVSAQATTVDSGDNDVDTLGDTAGDYESNIDAGDMTSVQNYINDNSRADLTIEDVSRNSNITTLTMRETDPGDVDYNVFFDPENITAPGTADSGATLVINLANVLNIANDENPIENFSSVSFSVGTTEVTADISTATSYAEVVSAIEAAIADAGLVGLEVSSQAAQPAYFSINVAGFTAGQLAGSYNPILITNSGSGELTPGTITLAEDATNSNMTNTMTNAEGSTIPSLTQTNVVFDRVGRDSQGGDFLAGSDSTGDSGSAGIEQFNVEVDRNSWLTSVSSTNNTLEVINIENIAVNSDGNGSLTIDSLTDVRVVDASAMTGSANITAELTTDVVAKYLDLTDDQADASADNSDDAFLNVVDTFFSYDFGSNDDTFNLTLTSANLEAAGTIEREDFVLEINGNDGDDTITTDILESVTNWYVNSQQNSLLTVNGGTGNDTITTTGAGDMIIDGGAGNDTIYADNSGDVARWAINSGTTVNTIDNLVSDASLTTFLYDGELTVTFADLVLSSIAAAADSVSGYEVTVNIGTGANYTVTTANINQAIKDAINNDAVLSKLLVAQDGPANTLVITSLIDGVSAADSLEILVSEGTDVDSLTGATATMVTAAYQNFADDSSLTLNDAGTANAGSVVTLNAIDGLNSTFANFEEGTYADEGESNNIITGGNGDDVIVLGTDFDSNDTVVFSGTFGSDTIVNFVDIDVTADTINDFDFEATASEDILDFTAYFTNVETLPGTSTSIVSQTVVPTTFVGQDTAANGLTFVDGNSVAIINTVGFDTTDTFAGLTAANLLSSIQDDSNTANDYAGLDAGTLDSNNANADLVGTSMKSIVMIENNNNLGEYKVFELTSSTTTDEFTEATLVGTVDFGYSINIDADNLA